MRYKADLQREVNGWIVQELGGTPWAADAPVADTDPLFEQTSLHAKCTVFADRVEVQPNGGPVQVMRASEIKEVRTEWGRMWAFAKVVIEAHDGRRMEIGHLHMRQAKNLQKTICQRTLEA
jgi:hypothetical protein